MGLLAVPHLAHSTLLASKLGGPKISHLAHQELSLEMRTSSCSHFLIPRPLTEGPPPPRQRRQRPQIWRRCNSSATTPAAQPAQPAPRSLWLKVMMIAKAISIYTKRGVHEMGNSHVAGSGGGPAKGFNGGGVAAPGVAVKPVWRGWVRPAPPRSALQASVSVII